MHGNSVLALQSSLVVAKRRHGGKPLLLIRTANMILGAMLSSLHTDLYAQLVYADGSDKAYCVAFYHLSIS